MNIYTEHKLDLYARINLALASDAPALRQHGEFIKELRHSVLSLPLLSHRRLFRGVDMSEQELRRMEGTGRFFIPSFTSTSVRPRLSNKSRLKRDRSEALSVHARRARHSFPPTRRTPRTR